MQAVSQAYKEMMKIKAPRSHSFIRVTIGLINQEAQSGAFVSDIGNYTYYSNLKWPLDNYEVKELYVTCDQDYVAVNSSMYFLPRKSQDVVLNQGIVTDQLLGVIEIHFSIPHDLKGLTINFGKAYAVDFVIESNHNVVEIIGNTDSQFITEEIFEAATFLRFIPAKMINGQSRFRIHQITMGMGIFFDNRTILSATKREHISPVSEELPTLDFDLKIDNKDRIFDIENEESTVNFLEIGQTIEVLYGQELENGTIEWMPGATTQLKSWSADDKEMSFSSSDRFDSMDNTYYRGLYRTDGISLYDLAVDVFKDAGIDNRTYWLDQYLKDIIVYNPMPVVQHKEALQLIANAGRCVIGQDRFGNIFVKSSFVPDMSSSSDNETYYSHASKVLNKAPKCEYALAGNDYSDVKPTQFFLPRENKGAAYLSIGYISDAVADDKGEFIYNPTLVIALEASYKCFGLTLEFGRNHPAEMVFHAYHNEVLVEDYVVRELAATTVINHEFPEFDYLVLEFTKGVPYNRIVLDNIVFGDSTDYVFEYGCELFKTPKGTQLAKVRELQIVRTLYSQNSEVRELAKEKISVSSFDNQYTFYFSNPSYDFSCALTDPQSGQGVEIVSSSNYFVMVEITGITGQCEVSISGKEYLVTKAKASRQLNPTGSLEIWENPLVSDMAHAVNLADWIGDYLKADREYDLSYRGEPRIDTNDIAFLENKYVPDLLLRIYDHTLNFNGALSGTIKARRDMSYVATAKNRLEAK